MPLGPSTSSKLFSIKKQDVFFFLNAAFFLVSVCLWNKQKYTINQNLKCITCITVNVIIRIFTVNVILRTFSVNVIICTFTVNVCMCAHMY